MPDREQNTTPYFVANTQHRLHKRTFGTIKQFDGSELLRETEIPRGEKKSLVLAVVLAIIVAFFVLLKVTDVLLLEPMRIENAIQTNASRDVSYEFPRLSDYITMSNDSIVDAESEVGHITVLYPGGDNDDGAMDIMKLPSDIDEERGTAFLEEGIASLPPNDAALLLKGSYRITVDRANGTTMRIRYADFSSSSHEEAITTALESQSFESIEYSESGIDTSGNTYQTGLFTRDGETYVWRISVINLDEVYDIGMPKDSLYVGIRVETT